MQVVLLGCPRPNSHGGSALQRALATEMRNIAASPAATPAAWKHAPPEDLPALRRVTERAGRFDLAQPASATNVIGTDVADRSPLQACQPAIPLLAGKEHSPVAPLSSPSHAPSCPALRATNIVFPSGRLALLHPPD